MKQVKGWRLDGELVECLPGTPRPWVQHCIKKGRCAGDAYDPSIWEVEAGGSEVQGHPQLYREFEASLQTKPNT